MDEKSVNDILSATGAKMIDEKVRKAMIKEAADYVTQAHEESMAYQTQAHNDGFYNAVLERLLTVLRGEMEPE